MPNKLTIIKVISNDGHPTSLDLERWRQIFAEKSMTEQQALDTGEVLIQHIDRPSNEDDHYITFVKIGDEDYKPTFADLESWRAVFEEGKNDPDFKVFTHSGVSVETIRINEIIAVDEITDTTKD